MNVFQAVARRLSARFTPHVECAGCGRVRGEGTRFISGAHSYLCEHCVAAAVAAAEASIGSDAGVPTGCHFCGQYRRPIAFAGSATVHACRECVELMAEVLDEDEDRPEPS